MREENALNDDNKEKGRQRPGQRHSAPPGMNTYVVKVHKKRLMALILSLSLFLKLVRSLPLASALSAVYCLCGGFAVSSSFSYEWECS